MVISFEIRTVFVLGRPRYIVTCSYGYIGQYEFSTHLAPNDLLGEKKFGNFIHVENVFRCLVVSDH